MVVGFLKWLNVSWEHCFLCSWLSPQLSWFLTVALGRVWVRRCPCPGGCTAPALSLCAQPNGRDVLSPEELSLTSAPPFSCCFFCHKHILQELLKGECWSLFAAFEEAARKRKAAFVVCVVPLASSLNLVLWAEVSTYEPDVTWKVMTAALGYSWMIVAFLPSAAGWQAQRNADLSQNEIKHGT